MMLQILIKLFKFGNIFKLYVLASLDSLKSFSCHGRCILLLHNSSHDAIFFNHGQNCCAGSRTFVQEGIYDEFVAKAKAKALERRVGDPWTENVQQGPLVIHI